MTIALALAAAACSLLLPFDELHSGVDSAADGSTPDGAMPDDPMPDASTTDGVMPDGRLTDGQTVHPYRDAVLADSPVLYLRFSETSGTVAADEMSQYDGTYGGGVVLGAAGAIAGDPDTAVAFDGTQSSVVVLPPGLDFADKAPFSVEVWVLPTSTAETVWAIDHQTFGDKRNGWGLNVGASHVALERWRDDTHTGPGTRLPLAQGKYHHVVATFDGDKTIVYVDGVASAEGSGGLSMLPMTSGWTVGGQNCPCSALNFVGSLDELAIYDKALPADRVLAHLEAAGR